MFLPAISRYVNSFGHNEIIPCLYINMYLVKIMIAKALWDSNHGDRMHHHCPIGSTIVNRCTDAGSFTIWKQLN